MIRAIGPRVPLVLLALFAALVTVGAGPSTAAPTLSPKPLDRVCLVTSGGFLDATEPARNDVPDDVPVAATSWGGTFATFYGLKEPFRAIDFDVGVGGPLGRLDWDYWSSGGGWWDLNRHAKEPSFNEAGQATLSFPPPDDWEPRVAFPECPDSFYWIRSSTDAAYNVIPMLTQATALV